MVLHVLKHELRLVFREPRFWIPFVIPPVILAASQGIAVSRYGGQIMEGMEGYMMLLLGCLMAPMGAPLAADSFAGERERNSLELLQLSPVKPTLLFWGKFLAVLPFPLAFSLLGIACYWGAHSNVPAPVALNAAAGSVCACLLITAFTLLLSLRSKTVRAATQSSLILVIPLFLVMQLGHEPLLAGASVAFAVLGLSVVATMALVAVSMRKFTNRY